MALSKIVRYERQDRHGQTYTVTLVICECGEELPIFVNVNECECGLCYNRNGAKLGGE